MVEKRRKTVEINRLRYSDAAEAAVDTLTKAYMLSGKTMEEASDRAEAFRGRLRSSGQIERIRAAAESRIYQRVNRKTPPRD